MKHRESDTGFEWWVPPGGGVEGGESIYDCARRETYEETGLTVVLGKLLYLRECVDLDSGWHMLEVFILANSFNGNLTIKNVRREDADSDYIKEVRFLSQEEMKEVIVFPEIFKERPLLDLVSDAHMGIQYLGQQRTNLHLSFVKKLGA